METFTNALCRACKLCVPETKAYDFSRDAVVDASCVSEEGPSVKINSERSPYDNFIMAGMQSEARKRISNKTSCFVSKTG